MGKRANSKVQNEKDNKQRDRMLFPPAVLPQGENQVSVTSVKSVPNFYKIIEGIRMPGFANSSFRATITFFYR